MTFRAAFYRGTHSGVPGLYNRAVRLWTISPFSHAELVFSDGMCGSSSFMDGGVRLKEITFKPALWDFVEIPLHLEAEARQWFGDRLRQPYDLLGNLHFMLGPVQDEKGAWFCSESIAAALGVPEPWRYDPATLHSCLSIFNKPAPAGFSL